MNIELKPCPFCGGEAEMMGDQYPYVECQECGAGFTANHSYEFDEDDAASKWNARSTVGPNLKPIAESKVRQLGGDVCGVLVRKDGRLAAVDEHGRVQWLQDGQGVEPAGYLHNRPERIPCFFETLDDARLSGCEVVPVYTHPQPAVPEAMISLVAICQHLRDHIDERGTSLICHRGVTLFIDALQSAEAVTEALLSAPTTPQPEGDGWISQRHIQATGFSGWCWIVHKGKVQEAYRDKKGAYRFHAGSSDCYMSECVTFVMPWQRPQPPVEQGEE